MMRLFKFSFVAVMAVLFVTTTASAVEISIQGPTSATITSGGAFSISLGIDNVSLDNTPGFEGTISGLAAAGATVTGGASATSFLNQFCFAGSGCFNGLSSINNAFYNPNDLSANYTPGDDSLLAINVAGVTFSANDGSIDLGLANDIAGATPSPIDATINLIATTVGVHLLTIGGAWSDGVNVINLPTSTFTLTVVPEPGTALLMGLGLAGLAAAGRRSE